MAIIGRRNPPSIARAAAPSVGLTDGELGEILLPGRYSIADKHPCAKRDIAVCKSLRITFTKPVLERLSHTACSPGS